MIGGASAMAKIKWKDIEVEADTAYDAVVLLDKLITYQKIREVNVDALAYCPVCKSFDLHMTAPNEVKCNLCGSTMEAFDFDDDTESFIELEFEDEIEQDEQNEEEK
jgi:hypothetical protein